MLNKKHISALVVAITQKTPKFNVGDHTQI